MIGPKIAFYTFLFSLTFFLTGKVEIAVAQNSSNFIQYNNNTALTFTLNSTSLLENQQTITNAFCLFLKSAANSAHYYVSASASTTTSTPMPINNLSLLFYSTDCPNGNYSSLSNYDIPLSNSNQLLFASVKKNNFYHFCYSVKLAAAGYTYAPGTYTFTITFTMSQP